MSVDDIIADVILSNIGEIQGALRNCFQQGTNFFWHRDRHICMIAFPQSVSSFSYAVSLPIIHWLEQGCFFQLPKKYQKIRRQVIWQSDSCRLTRRIEKSPRLYRGTSDSYQLKSVSPLRNNNFAVQVFSSQLHFYRICWLLHWSRLFLYENRTASRFSETTPSF